MPTIASLRWDEAQPTDAQAERLALTFRQSRSQCSTSVEHLSIQVEDAPSTNAQGMTDARSDTSTLEQVAVECVDTGDTIELIDHTEPPAQVWPTEAANTTVELWATSIGTFIRHPQRSAQQPLRNIVCFLWLRIWDLVVHLFGRPCLETNGLNV